MKGSFVISQFLLIFNQLKLFFLVYTQGIINQTGAGLLINFIDLCAKHKTRVENSAELYSFHLSILPFSHSFPCILLTLLLTSLQFIISHHHLLYILSVLFSIQCASVCNREFLWKARDRRTEGYNAETGQR